MICNPSSGGALTTDSIIDYFEKGNAKYTIGDYNEAIARYNKAIDLDPKFANAYNNRGLAKYAQGDSANAITDFNKAIQLNSDYADAYNNRGVVKDELGDYTGAIADYTKAIQLDRRYADAYNNRGVAKEKSGSFDDAIKDYNEAVKINPDFADAFNNRGNAKFIAGDYQKALADYNKAIDLDPENADAFNNRGYFHERTGKFELSIEDYRKVLAYSDYPAEADKNLADLFNVLNGNTNFISKIQSILTREGYYRDPIDGVLGLTTEAAIRAFQAEHQLAATGRINDRTHRLLVAKELDKLNDQKKLILHQKIGTPAAAFQVNFPNDHYQTSDREIPLDVAFAGNDSIESIVVKVNNQNLKGQTEVDYNTDRTIANIDFRIPLVNGENTISLVAFTENGLIKKKLTVIHNPTTDKAEKKGQKWAVVIGVENYLDPAMSDLDYSVDDAEDFARVLIKHFNFSQKNIRLLSDQRSKDLEGIVWAKPTSENIRKALLTDLRQKKKDDTIVIYYSGHGVLVPDPTAPHGKTAYLAPSDFILQAEEVRGIKLEEVKRRAYLSPDRIFFILDSCFSGGGDAAVKSVAIPGFSFKSNGKMITEGFAKIGEKIGKGRVLISSSMDNQVSIEDGRIKNSVFTYYLVDILSREKRLSEVFSYVSANVHAHTQGNQEPRLDILEQQGQIVLF